MYKMLKQMKGKESKMSSHEKDAKMGVLSHLRDMAQESMGSKLHGLKKVSVMSDKPEGLEMGLAKAKELVKHLEEGSSEEEMSESPDVEASEGSEQEMSEEEMTPEEIDAQIEHLMALKQSLNKKE